MEEKEQTINIASRIPLNLFAELCNEIKDIGQTKSEFIKEAIEDKLLNYNKELIEAEIKYLEKKVSILKAKKVQAKTKKKEMDKLSESEIQFLKESKDILIKNPTFIKGRINLYKNLFGKYYKIGEQEFWELMDKVE